MDTITFSKQLSRILRHGPDAAGVQLDTHGWCNVNELLNGLARLGTPATRDLLERVVRESDRQRFVLEGDRIRAAQGHSVNGVKPILREKTPQAGCSMARLLATF